MEKRIKKMNRYQLVHAIAARAKEKEVILRDPLKKEEYMPTVNKIREKENTVKKSHDEIMYELKNDLLN